MGTRVTLSSSMPAVDDRSIQIKIITQRRMYFLSRNFFKTTPIIYFRIPLSSMMRKVPPISTIIAIIARPVVIVDVPKTRKIESGIFQIGIL